MSNATQTKEAEFDVKGEIAKLNELGRLAGRLGTLKDAIQQITDMAPVYTREDEGLDPQQLMAYRRAKRQAVAILQKLFAEASAAVP